MLHWNVMFTILTFLAVAGASTDNSSEVDKYPDLTAEEAKDYLENKAEVDDVSPSKVPSLMLGSLRLFLFVQILND
ncbi:hypothetical protein FOZ62_010868, partial [Perkinsus olseni]